MEKTTEERREHIENLTGGNVVIENAREVFRAIRNGKPGIIEVEILIHSLPTEEARPLLSKIQEIKNKNHNEILKLTKRMAPGSGYLPLQKQLAEQERRHLLQIQSADITQVVIDYLNKIGQWWLQSRSNVEQGSKTLFASDEVEDNE